MLFNEWWDAASPKQRRKLLQRANFSLATSRDLDRWQARNYRNLVYEPGGLSHSDVYRMESLLKQDNVL
ncbi:MAG: hypothetical protein ACOZAO_00815 [Patescibacteria group bacterium]